MWLAQSHCLAMCRLWWMHVVVIVLFWRQSCTHCSQCVCGMGLCFQGSISCVESLAVHRDMDRFTFTGHRASCVRCRLLMVSSKLQFQVCWLCVSPAAVQQHAMLRGAGVGHNCSCCMGVAVHEDLEGCMRMVLPSHTVANSARRSGGRLPCWYLRATVSSSMQVLQPPVAEVVTEHHQTTNCALLLYTPKRHT